MCLWRLFSTPFSSIWAMCRLSIPTGFAVHVLGEKGASSPLNFAMLSCRSEQTPGVTDAKEMILYGEIQEAGLVFVRPKEICW